MVLYPRAFFCWSSFYQVIMQMKEKNEHMNARSNTHTRDEKAHSEIANHTLVGSIGLRIPQGLTFLWVTVISGMFKHVKSLECSNENKKEYFNRGNIIVLSIFPSILTSTISILLSYT